jgi:hypothetical protein
LDSPLERLSNKTQVPKQTFFVALGTQEAQDNCSPYSARGPASHTFAKFTGSGLRPLLATPSDSSVYIQCTESPNIT